MNNKKIKINLLIKIQFSMKFKKIIIPSNISSINLNYEKLSKPGIS